MSKPTLLVTFLCGAAAVSCTGCAPPSQGDSPADSDPQLNEGVYNRPFLGAGYPLADADFQLNVEVQEALEGGPLVLKASLTNNGKEARRVVQHAHNDFQSSDVSVDAPKEWDFHSMVYGGSHIHPDPEITLQPGDKLTQTLRLHRVFRHIPSGKVVLPIWWHVCEPISGKEERITWATTTLELDMPTATPGRVDALRKRMESRMRDKDLTYSDRRILAEDLLFTHHLELAPVAWDMVESPYSYGYPRPLWFIQESGTPCEEIDARVLKLLEKPDWPGAYDVFLYWDDRKQPLSDQHFQQLLDSGSVWTRALTYTTFPKRCDTTWKASLMEDLRSQTKPVPAAQFAPLLAALDSDDFEARERASAGLTHLGERVEAQLRQAQDGHLSAEARRRVTEVLDRLREAKQPSDCMYALEWSEFCRSAANGEILQVLAEGQADAWLTQQAKEKLSQWRKTQGLPDK